MSHVTPVIVSGNAFDAAYKSIPFDMVTLPILHGARRSCCDEAAVVVEGGQTVAIATIAPDGEENDGRPTIVGVWVATSHRKQGLGQAVALAVLRRCEERGLTPVTVDLMSTRVEDLFDRAPEELKELVRVKTRTSLLDFAILAGS